MSDPRVRLVPLKIKACRIVNCQAWATDSLWVEGQHIGDYCPRHANEQYAKARAQH